MIATLIVSVALVGQAREHAIFEPYDVFDKISNKGKTSIDLGPVLMEEIPKISLRLVTLYEGRSRPANPEVVFVFESKSPDWRFLKFHEVYLLSDGGRFNPKSSQDGDVQGRGVSETVLAILPFSDFCALIKSRGLQGKVGSFTFQLSEDQVLAMKIYQAILAKPGVGVDQILQEIRENLKREKDAKIAGQTPDAEKLLQEAKALDRANKAVKALEIYRTIVRKYPETEAGKQAAARVKVITKAKR